MTRRIFAFILVFCLLISSAFLTAHAERTITVGDLGELYAAFPVSDDRIIIPADTYLEINGALSVDQTITIEDGAEVIVGEDARITASVENNGFLEINPGAVLAPPQNGAIVNRGSLNVYDGATLKATDGSLTNSGYLLLYGKMFIGVDGSDQKSRFINTGDLDCDAESTIVVMQADHTHPADLTKAAGAFTQTDSRLFIEADSSNGLITLQNNSAADGVFLNAPDGSIAFNGDLTLKKPLWINDCDLVLEHGSTLTVNKFHNNLLFSRGGRIVCEESGGCLILDQQPLICGAACTAPLCPTSGSVSLCSDRTAEDRYYPLPAQEAVIGKNSEVCARGALSDETDIGVRIDRGGVLKLCHNFSCPLISDDGRIETSGYTLDCGVINYGAFSVPADGKVNGEALYELTVDVNDGSSAICRGFAAAGDRVYLEYLDVDTDSLTEEDGFLGWEASSPWVPAPTVAVNKDTDEDSYDYGWYYLTMPAYPLTVTALRESKVVLGDADRDGEVTVTDATAVQFYLAELPNERFDESAADVDSEDGVTVLDAALIQRFAAGVDTPYPIGSIAVIS